jgi:hypothetical protein
LFWVICYTESPMRQRYLLVLLTAVLGICAFAPDREWPYTTTDDTPKLTHLFPNPATSYINFSFDKSIDRSYTLQVYNFIGRKTYESRVTDSRITITLDDSYFRGLYIYQLRDASGRIVESGKFQVNK